MLLDGRCTEYMYVLRLVTRARGLLERKEQNKERAVINCMPRAYRALLSHQIVLLSTLRSRVKVRIACSTNTIHVMGFMGSKKDLYTIRAMNLNFEIMRREVYFPISSATALVFGFVAVIFE